jgi:polyphosphate glucokinase
MKTLVIDVGGPHVRVLATGHDTPREFAAGPDLTPEQLVAESVQAANGWEYEAVSIGYPGPVLRGQPVADPVHLGSGWAGFDFEAAFHRPVKLVHSVALHALGCYEGGWMLYLSLNSSICSAVIAEGLLEVLELGHLPYKKKTLDDYVGISGWRRLGKKKWRNHVAEVVGQLAKALQPDDVVLGGDNAERLKELPAGWREGVPASAFQGGFRLWEAREPLPSSHPRVKRRPTEQPESNGG